MSNKIFSKSNTVSTNVQSVSTLDMTSTTKNNYSVGGAYSATSPMATDFNINSIKQKNSNIIPNNMFVKLGNLKQSGGNIGQVKSISSINQSELRNLFATADNTTQAQPTQNNTVVASHTNSDMPGNINDLIGRLQAMSESKSQNGGTENAKTVSQNIIKAVSQKGGNDDEDGMFYDDDQDIDTSDNDENIDQEDLEGGGGNKEILEAMSKLNKHIASKAGIIFGKAMKVAKYYRDEAKKSNPNADTIELNKLAMKLVDKDADAGKLESVVKKIHGTSASRSKKNSSKGPKKIKGKKHEKKKGGCVSSDDISSPNVDSDSDELSFITTSED